MVTWLFLEQGDERRVIITVLPHTSYYFKSKQKKNILIGLGKTNYLVLSLLDPLEIRQPFSCPKIPLTSLFQISHLNNSWEVRSGQS